MAKNFFQDMIKMKSDLRKESGVSGTIESPKIYKPEVVNTPQPKEAREVRAEVAQQKEEVWPPVVANKVTRRIDSAPVEPHTKPRFSIWLVAGVAIIFLFFAVSYLFAQASITINPKTKDVPLNQNLSASKDHAEESLLLDIVVISDEESKKVSGELQDAAVRATGTVLIYNNFSSATQRLDIDTRLEGSNGKMYKTVKAVAVPGIKGKTPGSVEVGIYATEAGEAYNSPPLDFKIFGFKGTPKYSKFYARSKTGTVISGGITGKVSFIPESKRPAIVAELKFVLEDKLKKKAAGLTPPGFIMFADDSSLNIDSQDFDFKNSVDGLVPVTVKGTLSGFILDEKELTNKIVTGAIPDYDGNDVYISNLKDLTFTLLNKGVAEGAVNSISFNLAGTPKIVWKLDTEKLIGEVVGKSKKDFYQTLAKYPNVVSADVVLRPFWKFSFPSSKNDIKITVNYPN